MQRYSAQFRNTILKKMIGPEKRSAPDLSGEYGVSVATIYGWKSKLKDGTLSVIGYESFNTTRSPQDVLFSAVFRRTIYYTGHHLFACGYGQKKVFWYHIYM